MKKRGLSVLTAMPLCWLVCVQGRGEMSEREAVETSRAYLAAGHEAGREALRQKLTRYAGRIDPVLRALRPAAAGKVKPGLSGLQHFSAPGLREKYKDDHLYYYVPESYDPARPTGLLIYMHGGGGGTAREYAGRVIDKAHKNANGIAFFVDKIPYVTVSPSAPWSEQDSNRWARDEAEAYLAAVITESEHRFAIDPDRIVLAGTSMGGMGAMHLGLRMPDRFAAVSPGSAAWGAAYWPVTTGTPFFIIHGANDAVPPGHPTKAHRPKFTDVFYAREAHRLLEEYGIEHIYAEHDGGHSSQEAKPQIEQFCRWIVGRRRDPHQKRVVAATPADGKVDQPHNRWVTLLEVGEGTIVLDGAQRRGGGGWKETLEQWNECRIERRTHKKKGGVVDAVNEGSNRFTVKTENVKRFALWLHPKMADLAKPVVVSVNGKTVRCHARPSLTDALRSYERRRDWGLVYHAELVCDVPE
ncbi:MAG: hypothetical protein JXR37_32970 [Kiritimatiellae bacterium]|nr:hypothetical protein [Kiritimatiellia bacterium]